MQTITKSIPSFALFLLLLFLPIFAILYTFRAEASSASPTGSNVLINEIDSDTPTGDETSEFIELYDGGSGNTPLDGLVVVLYNGSNNLSYEPVFDLDGYTTNDNGYFVIGGTAIPSADIVVTTNTWLQNGADAVALYNGNDSDFPAGTPVTTSNLIDAIVYDTDDSDDPELLVLLNAGQPQVNENGANDKDAHSNQRCPNGSGGLRNTTTYLQDISTPSEPNNCPDTPQPGLGVSLQAPAYGFAGEEVVYEITISNLSPESANDIVLTDTLPTGVAYLNDDSGVLPTNPSAGVYVWSLGDLPPTTTLTIALTGEIGSGVDPNTILTNMVAVSTTSEDDPSDNADQANTTVTEIVPIATARAGSNGQIFAVQGKVIVTPNTYNSSGWALQDDSGGIGVFYDPPPAIALGDTVRLVGVRGSFNGEEQFSSALYFAHLGSGAEVPPTSYSTGDVAAGLSEGWLAQVEGIAIADETCDGGDEFVVDDGSGEVVIFVDGDTGIDVCGQGLVVGSAVRVIGFSTEFNGVFEIKPRRPFDVATNVTAPLIMKTAPTQVNPSQLFTYTISVENLLGYDLTGVVVTDTVPANATFAYALDGGSVSGGVVSWNLPALSDGQSETVRFAVMSAGTPALLISNDQYAITAANYLTPTFGTPVLTFIGDYAPIALIQGSTSASPFEGAMVKTEGIVTSFFEGNYSEGGIFNGFFIQDPVGDGNPDSSEGLFVNHGSLNLTVNVGDRLSVQGIIQEFDEYEGSSCPETDCLTQIYVTNAANITVIGSGTILSTEIVPLGDPDEGEAYFESLEGMLVHLDDDGAVVGPTSFNTINVIPEALGVNRVLRNTPYEGMPFGVRHYERYGEINGNDPPSLIVGSVAENIDGPFTFSFGNYLVITQQGDAWGAVFSQPLPTELPAWDAPADNEFTAATFNTLNFDQTGTHLTKVVTVIEQMNFPVFLALEEVAVESVMEDLLVELAELGYEYEYGYSHPDVGGHGVALIWRTDRVISGDWSTEYQTCSANGSDSSVGYDDYCEGTGLLPLFARRPVVLTATVSLEGADPLEVVVIANHFKSKLGGAPSDQRRLEEAQFVAGLVDQFVADGFANVLVMGDLNDFEDSPTLESLTASGNLQNLWFDVPAENRYSYNFRGVSQILDHILATPALHTALVDVAPLHFNADYPFNPYSDQEVVWRTSDHDQVIATFTVPEEPVLHIAKSVETMRTPVYPGDWVTFTVTLHNMSDVPAINVLLTDSLPAGLIGDDLLETVTVPAQSQVSFTYSAQIAEDSWGMSITNTAAYSHSSGSGSASVTLAVTNQRLIFLPILIKP